MAYSLSPNPTDKLKDSQNDILQNFTAIKAAFDINHVTFDLADQGKHAYISFPEQVAAPATAVNERAVYCKQSLRTGLAELFTRKENSGNEAEFTAALISSAAGWTILPSGLIVKWGFATANGSYTLVFPDDGDVAIPRFATILSVQLTVLEAGATDVDKAIRLMTFGNPLQIDVYGSSRSTTGAASVPFEYFVIGA